MQEFVCNSPRLWNHCFSYAWVKVGCSLPKGSAAYRCWLVKEFDTLLLPVSNGIPESLNTCLSPVNLWGNHDFYCWWFRNPANQLRLVGLSTMIYIQGFLYIQKAVFWDFWNHQPYHVLINHQPPKSWVVLEETLGLWESHQNPPRFSIWEHLRNSFIHIIIWMMVSNDFSIFMSCKNEKM